MSFREKSAWGMGALLGAAGLLYLYLVRAASVSLGETAPPQLAIAFVLLMVIGAVVVQTVLALSAPRAAGTPADERERIAGDRAGHWSGLLLAAGIVCALGHFMAFGDGNMLFHLAEYGLEILLLRRSF
jgi:hypothetical protein